MSTAVAVPLEFVCSLYQGENRKRQLLVRYGFRNTDSLCADFVTIPIVTLRHYYFPLRFEPNTYLRWADEEARLRDTCLCFLGRSMESGARPKQSETVLNPLQVLHAMIDWLR